MRGGGSGRQPHGAIAVHALLSCCCCLLHSLHALTPHSLTHSLPHSLTHSFIREQPPAVSSQPVSSHSLHTVSRLLHLLLCAATCCRPRVCSLSVVYSPRCTSSFRCVMGVLGAAGVKLANKRRNAVNKQRHHTALTGSSTASSKRSRVSKYEGGAASVKPTKRRRTAASDGRAAHFNPAADSGHIDDIASALLADDYTQDEREDGSGGESSSSEGELAEFEAAPRRFAVQPNQQQRLPVRSATGGWTDSAEEERRSRQQQWLNRHTQPQQQHQRPLQQIDHTADMGRDVGGTESEDEGARGVVHEEEDMGSARLQRGRLPTAAPSADDMSSADEMRRQRQRRVSVHRDGRRARE